MKNDIKNQSRFVKNPSKIDPKTIPDRWNCVLGAFSAPNCAQVGFRRAPGRIRQKFWLIFEILCEFLGPFPAPQEIADRSKIVLLSIDGQFDRRKMPSGREWGTKTWKLHEKSIPKSKVFDCSEPRLALYTSLISHFFHFRKNRKTDAKMEPKSRVFCSKVRPWKPKGRLILRF